jgi:hypothetical protein
MQVRHLRSNGTGTSRKGYLGQAVKLLKKTIQGGSDKSGIFFFLLSNETAELKIIRFD